MTDTLRSVNWEGHPGEWILIQTDDGHGVLTTAACLSRGLPSYAVIDGEEILRYGRVVGRASEIADLGPAPEIVLESEALDNVLNDDLWAKPADE